MSRAVVISARSRAKLLEMKLGGRKVPVSSSDRVRMDDCSQAQAASDSVHAFFFLSSFFMVAY